MVNIDAIDLEELFRTDAGRLRKVSLKVFEEALSSMTSEDSKRLATYLDLSCRLQQFVMLLLQALHGDQLALDDFDFVRVL